MEHDLFIAGVLAGLFSGCGIGIVFKYGGTDIIARILDLKLGIPVGKSLLALDAFVLTIPLSYLDIKHMIYTLLASFILSRITDSIQAGSYAARGLFIISDLNIKDTPVLERVIQSLYSSIGSQISINKITNTLKSAGYSSSNKTVDRHLGGILNSLLMYEAKRYDIRGRQLLNSQSKYYGVDMGIRNILLPDHQEDFGHIIENIVYLELLRRNKAVYVGESSKYEVDFVGISDMKQLSYYQVALTTMDEKVLKRELRSLEQIRDSYPKYLLTLDTINRTANYNGIQKLNLIDWLLS